MNRTISEPKVHGMRPRLRLSGPSLLVAVFVLLVAAAGQPAYGKTDIKPSQIPDKLEQRGKNLTALKAVMQVSTYRGEDNSHHEIKGFLIYRRPSDFRFQGLAPGGNTLFELVLRWNRFELYVPQERTVLKGSKKCFKRRFPDVAELDHLIPLALLQWRGVKLKEVVSASGNPIVLAIEFKGDTWRCSIEPERLVIVKMERMVRGRADVTAQFGDFRKGKFGWLPQRYDVRSDTANWRTLIHIKKMEFNPFLVEKNFRIDPAFKTKTETCE